MLPRRVLASRSARLAATVLTAATLALAGCKIETSGSGLSSSGSASARWQFRQQFEHQCRRGAVRARPWPGH